MALLTCVALVGLAPPDFKAARALDDTINAAIGAKRLPGAVLVVGQDDHILYRKAYGNRAVEPKVEPMTPDTIFDLASLTKVIATTSSIMRLEEQGKIRINDRVTAYLPEFQGGRSAITVRDLLTHFSGLRPDVPLTPAWNSYDAAIKLALQDPPQAQPGERHIYSDTNFILLGEIVRKLSGQSLADFSRQQVFLPLGMKETQFLPPANLKPRIAPTQNGLRGTVHDPRAAAMGGVAGHAGLFSTADDLALFAQEMLRPRKVFSPATVRKFTEPQTPPDQPVLRGLGWDIDSPYSSNRGELYPIGSYGHTGFTGTSIWIDPTSRSYVILLSNSVHPNGTGNVLALRAKVATIVAAAVGVGGQKVTLSGYNDLMTREAVNRPIYRNGRTLTGLDVLEAENFASLKGLNIGLITNQTGLDRNGKRNIDVMLAGGVKIGALFSPEHGFAGAVDKPGIQDTVDPATGLKVFSLYGETLRPKPEMLKGVDALVFDIQDVGVHFYTYESTMAYALEEAAKAKIPFIVLDRPNPITGTRVEGPCLDAENTSFVGYLEGMPVRHGMTMGELAKMFNGENHLGADVRVVEMKDWERGDWFDSTGLPWTNPSPNMRSLKAAILYPGLCLMEFPKNFSVGRGTDAPFEQVGADFIRGPELSEYLNHRNIPGIRTYPTAFIPAESRFKDVRCEGMRFEITDRSHVDSVRVGLELACAIEKLYPGKIDWSSAGAKRLIGSNDTNRRIAAGEDAVAIQRTLIEPLRAFTDRRERYLVYP